MMKWWRADRGSATNSVAGSLPHKVNAKYLVEPAHIKRAKRTNAAKVTQYPDNGWTLEQLNALEDAKMEVPTTVANFWAEVAVLVPGKTANECRAKSFDQYSTPPERKSKKRASEATASASHIPAKMARAGTNKFKKQVREFVQQVPQSVLALVCVPELIRCVLSSIGRTSVREEECGRHICHTRNTTEVVAGDGLRHTQISDNRDTAEGN